MLIWTAHLRPKRVLCLLLVIAILAGCIFLFVADRSETSKDGEGFPIETAHMDENEARIAFLSECGWTVLEEPTICEELIIPKKFDESYDDYLELQSDQGFHLRKYSGKRVTRYTYEITNYPSGEEHVQVNLLIYKGRIIGGEVFSPALEGFMHGLILDD